MLTAINLQNLTGVFLQNQIGVDTTLTVTFTVKMPKKSVSTTASESMDGLTAWNTFAADIKESSGRVQKYEPIRVGAKLQTGSLQIQKVVNSGAVSGYTFSISNESGVKLAEGTTGADGKVTFYNLQVNNVYKIKEIGTGSETFQSWTYALTNSTDKELTVMLTDDAPDISITATNSITSNPPPPGDDDPPPPGDDDPPPPGDDDPPPPGDDDPPPPGDDDPPPPGDDDPPPPGDDDPPPPGDGDDDAPDEPDPEPKYPSPTGPVVPGERYGTEIPDNLIPLGYVVIKMIDEDGDEYWIIEPEEIPLGTLPQSGGFPVAPALLLAAAGLIMCGYGLGKEKLLPEVVRRAVPTKNKR